MVELLEDIDICRLGDGTIHISARGFDEDIVYVCGNVDTEDLEDTFIGALKYYFSESEVWNGFYMG